MSAASGSRKKPLTLESDESEVVNALLGLSYSYSEGETSDEDVSTKNTNNVLSLPTVAGLNEFAKKQHNLPRSSTHVAIANYILLNRRKEAMKEESYSDYAREFLLPLLDPTITSKITIKKNTNYRSCYDIVAPSPMKVSTPVHNNNYKTLKFVSKKPRSGLKMTVKTNTHE